jgi:phytoene synthase
MSPPLPDSISADLAECRATLRHGSKSFHTAARLLPREVADSAVALYAFCRVADDAIDHAGGANALPGLQDRLRRAYDFRPYPLASDRALAWVVARHGIPRALPEALLEGFAWDAEGRRYENFSDVAAYATRVAGTVGAMMALLMGARSPVSVARACDLGIAMQFGNICRDVGEDARSGRIYLPLAWLREAGVDPNAWLTRPAFMPAIGTVVSRLLREADKLYARADDGIALLPAGCRPGIAAARLIYSEIGREVARNGFDSVSRRAVVRGRRKFALLAQSVAHAMLAQPGAAAPPVPEAAFLIDAVASAPEPQPLASVAEPRLSFDARIERLIAMFARLHAEEIARSRPEVRGI